MVVEALVDVAAAGGRSCWVCVGGESVEDGEGGSVDVERVVRVGLLVEGREDASWAKEDVGRIQERKRRFEESGNADR